MTDCYAVFGNPIAHSKSPQIHAAFARQTGQDLRYEAIPVPLDGFAAAVADFRAAGGKGANVTVPFKQLAYRLAQRLSVRAEAAKAVNTLVFDVHGISGENTDGIGLVADLTTNLGCSIAGQRVLLLGAGGAARGVILPLLQQGPASLTIANRTVATAEEMAEEFERVARLDSALAGAEPALSACGFPALAGGAFDLVINATAASLTDESPALPDEVFAPESLAYDMVYGKGLTPFLALARRQGAGRIADGLGMLVEQAAESFRIWRGVRPQTAPVLKMMRER